MGEEEIVFSPEVQKLIDDRKDVLYDQYREVSGIEDQEEFLQKLEAFVIQEYKVALAHNALQQLERKHKNELKVIADQFIKERDLLIMIDKDLSGAFNTEGEEVPTEPEE